MELSAKQRLTNAIGAFGIALAGGVVGFLYSDYSDFRSERRAEFRKEYQEAQTAATKVLAHLQAFSDQARGEGVVSASEKAAFRKNVTVLYQDAKDVAERAPQVTPVFDEYANAMVELQNAALSMTGPIDAKIFVETLSRFLKTRDDFDEQAQNAQKDYLGSLI